ncbi:MAG: YqgE/AlgH family protein [Rickettsiales bacterium]|nr:YqgE/AlgH family protein [Rickettsiales bacterium]
MSRLRQTDFIMNASNNGYLEGQLLVATPNVMGSSFKQSVILICAHSDEGAMGIIINHTLPKVDYGELFDQFDLPTGRINSSTPVNYGGPVEVNRGFVIYRHEDKFLQDAMLQMGDMAISGSIDLLRQIANNEGPKERILALGYAGWSPGQLEEEIEENSWISVPVDSDLVFDKNNDRKWHRAAFAHGIDLNKLSTVAGHA